MARLHWASRLGSIATVRECVNDGHDVNAKSRAGTPLMIAAREGHADIVAVLLAAGADPSPAHRVGIANATVGIQDRVEQ